MAPGDVDCQSSVSGRQSQKVDRLAHKSRMRHRRFLEKEALIEELARAFPLDDAIVGAAGPRARSGADLAGAVRELPEALERSFGCSASDAEGEFCGLPAAISCERSRLDAIVDTGIDSPAAGRGKPAKLDLVEQEQKRQKKYEKKLLAKLGDGDISEATMRQLLHTKGRQRGKGGEDETAEGGERLVDASRRDLDDGLSFLNRDRGARKQQQLGNFFHIVKLFRSLPVEDQESLSAHNFDGNSDRKRLRVIDFGCGSGNLCLPLAWRFPDIEFVFVDRNQVSLDLVAKRAQQARLQNVSSLQWEFDLSPESCVDNLERFIARINASPSDVRLPTMGIGLHCCGSLTDIVMEACRMMGAHCVVCPCCNGNVSMLNASPVAGSPLRYPRHPGPISEHDFVNLVCPMADHNAHAGGGGGPAGAGTAGGAPDVEAHSSLAKHVVEYDRAMWARQHWQDVRLVRLRPASCSPKNLVVMCFSSAAG